MSKRYKHKNRIGSQHIFASPQWSDNNLRKLTSSTPFDNNDINAAFAAASSALFNVGKYSWLS